MLKRVISAICYAVILIVVYCLKLFLPNEIGFFCMDALIYVFSLIGTYEMVRALKDRMTKWERGIVYGFAVVCIPVGVLMKFFLDWGTTAAGVCLTALTIALFSLLVFRHDETSLESMGLSFIAAVYPTIFLSMMIVANHAHPPATLVEFAFDSRLLILFMLVLAPIVDAFAFLFGMTLRKIFPQKIAPVLSPNKTIIGCVGGLVGGLVGATGIYFAYNALVGSFAQMEIWLPVYLLIGLVTAFATMFGDLVESCIKRKLGIKDMGDLLPGHGGILDRVDSTLYSTIAVYAIYALIVLIV